MRITRSGQVELGVLGLFLLIAVTLGWAQMIDASLVLNEAVQSQIDDFEPHIDSGIIKYYAEKEYVPDATNYSIYQGSYVTGACGPGTADGFWRGEVPDQSAVEDHFEQNIARELEYQLERLASGGGCELTNELDVDAAFEEEDDAIPWTNYSFSYGSDLPWVLTCRSNEQRFITSSRDESIRSTEMAQSINLIDWMTNLRIRYMDMYDESVELVESQDFEDLLGLSVERSSTVAVKECSGVSGGECVFDPDSVSFADDDPLENEQEALAGSKLQDALDDFAAEFTADNDRYELRLELVELEYRPYNIEPYPGFGDDAMQQISPSCVMSEQCSWKVRSCCSQPSDEPCELELAGARCHDDVSINGNQCGLDQTDGTSFDPAEIPGIDGTTWTENPWESGCNPTNTDPYSVEDANVDEFEPIDFHVGDAPAWTAEQRPLSEQVRMGGFSRGGGDRFSGGSSGGDSSSSDGGDSCSCSTSTRTKERFLQYGWETRGAWTFDLEATVVVKVTLVEKHHENPTMYGARQPVFSFYWEDTFLRGSGDTSVDDGDPSADGVCDTSQCSMEHTACGSYDSCGSNEYFWQASCDGAEAQDCADKSWYGKGSCSGFWGDACTVREDGVCDYGSSAYWRDLNEVMGTNLWCPSGTSAYMLLHSDPDCGGEGAIECR